MFSELGFRRKLSTYNYQSNLYFDKTPENPYTSSNDTF